MQYSKKGYDAAVNNDYSRAAGLDELRQVDRESALRAHAPKVIRRQRDHNTWPCASYYPEALIAHFS